ncbi:MAG: HAD hydrolase family protein [Pseudomonadota bacterium]|nr:HAD hydrolase family protein [Pseudomonadota bacterium]
MKRKRLSEKELVSTLSNIELVSLDTDGVLTDGGIYYDDIGVEMRKFNVKDGMGIKLLQSINITVAIISASSSPAIRHRAASLDIEHVYLGEREKLKALKVIVENLTLTMDKVLHMGDDLNDIPVMERVGCPIAVYDAVDEVIGNAVYVTEKSGGSGAVRDICDMIIAAKSGR